MNRRGILIGLSLGILGTASLAFAVAVYIQRLPDPETANRRGLFRWLIECELCQQDPGVQAVLLKRIEGELIAGVDFREVASLINDGQRKLLLENADYLGRLWFRREADRYLAEPPARRPILIGKQIDQIKRLAIMDQLSALEHWTESKSATAKGATVQSTPAGTIAALAGQSKRIERWLAEASPGDRQPMGEFFAALRDRLIVDALLNWRT